LSILLTPGQAGDNPQLPALSDQIRIAAVGRRGRPRSKPDMVLAAVIWLT